MSETLCQKCGKPIRGILSPPYKSVLGGVFLFLIAIALLGFSFVFNLKLSMYLRTQDQIQRQLRKEQMAEAHKSFAEQMRELDVQGEEKSRSSIPESEKQAEYKKIGEAKRVLVNQFDTNQELLMREWGKRAYNETHPYKIAFFASLALAAISAVFGTILHWVHLCKISRLPEKPYFVTAYIGAFLLVVPAIWCIVLAIFFLPLDRGEISYAIGLTTGNLVALYTCFHLLRATYRWVWNSDVHVKGNCLF